MRHWTLALSAVLLIAPSPTPAPSAQPSRALEVPDGFTFAAVGDLLEARPLLPLHNPGFDAVAHITQSADVAFGNGEMPLIDVTAPGIYPAAENGGSNIYGIPAVAGDIRAQGFTMVSRANNHSTDWGVAGMNMTDAFFDAAHVMHAGTGRDDAAARAARFVETPWGLMGLTSTTTTFEGNEPAGEPLGDVAARPGASVLNITPKLLVDRATLDGLKRYYSAPSYHEDDTVTADSITIYAQTYQLGSQPGIVYDMDKHDLAAILRGIRQGSALADFLVFSVHCHDSASGIDNDIPQGAFLRDLAHDVLDAGADVFVGHGPHQLGAIEIYKGKPIFYSLGNYIFQLGAVENVNLEGYRMLGLDPRTANDVDASNKLLKHYFSQPKYWQSVAVVMTYRHNAVETIKLYPLDLGESRAGTLRGVPMFAPAAEGEAILKHIEELSAPYHTRIEIEDGVGVIHVS
ncbi:MAG TPA: CapA family protein [Candidatus Aquilonibacter sp.]